LLIVSHFVNGENKSVRFNSTDSKDVNQQKCRATAGKCNKQMLSVHLNQLGKKFNNEWIFKDLSYDIRANQKLLISGGNGSGKSTLLQVLSGYITPSAGTATYYLGEKMISIENIKNYVSFASPYLQLIEDFTPLELIEHIQTYKPFVNNINTDEVIDRLELTPTKNKFIKQFSSGMKQRLKLGVAILSDTPLLLLDEPISNLDKNAISWYRQLISDYSENRTIIVCSNAIGEEHFFCDSELLVTDFKQPKKP
jgi:ABC-type multidrug transport system ATPase subunit